MKVLILAGLIAGGCVVARLALGPGWLPFTDEKSSGAETTQGQVSVVVAETDECAQESPQQAIGSGIAAPDTKNPEWLLGWVRDTGERSMKAFDGACKERK